MTKPTTDSKFRDHLAYCERARFNLEKASDRLRCVRDLMRDPELKNALGVADEALHLAIARFEFELGQHDNVYAEHRQGVVEWYVKNVVDAESNGGDEG